jgi:hypothetical protein
MELVQQVSTAQVDADHILQGARHEEVLLLQPQFLAAYFVVVWIKHLGDVFRVLLSSTNNTTKPVPDSVHSTV